MQRFAAEYAIPRTPQDLDERNYILPLSSHVTTGALLGMFRRHLTDDLSRR